MAETNIHTKLLNVQAKLKAPKNQYNSFGKYKYRNCEDILEAVKPLLAEQGLTLTLSDYVTAILENNRTYVKAVATLTDGKDTLEVCAYAREAETKKGMDDSQVTGATSSYARKYALNGLFLIDDTKDADSMDNTAGATSTPSKPKAKPKEQPEAPTAEEETRKLAKLKTNEASKSGIKIEGIKSYIQTQYSMNKAIKAMPIKDDKYVSKSIQEMTINELNRYIDHIDTLISDKQKLKEA